MRRFLGVSVLAALLAACSGGAGQTPAATQAQPTQPAAATAAPATAVAITNPPPTLIPGCLPQCLTPKVTKPGALSGPYTTRYFFGGQLTVTVPDGWSGREDSTGELALGRPNDESAGLEFWIDVVAVLNASGVEDKSVARTGDAVVAWFVKKPIHHVIADAATTLGGLPAVRIEYKRNPKATTEDPNCPPQLQPCSADFSYPDWDGAFEEGGPFHSQLVVANAMWGGQHHTIYVMFWADDASYPALIDQVNGVISSIQLPEGVGPAQ